LALAAAALLLIGFTGAVASQIILRGGLPFPGMSYGIPTGSMGEASQADVAQLALGSH
jgi:hypothetical protein